MNRVVILTILLFSCMENRQTKKVFFENGRIKSETEFVKGLKQGREIKYFSDGMQKSINYFIKDTLNGLSITYFPSGKIFTKVNFKNGVKDGEFFVFHENGNIYKYGHFRKGLRAGKCYEYYKEDSSRVASEAYILTVKGEEFLYYIKEFDLNGNVVHQERSIILSAPDSVRICLKAEVLIQLTDEFEFDSVAIIVGEFDNDFNAISKSDTLLIKDRKADFVIFPKIKGASFIRGILIGYKKEISEDSVYEFNQYEFFEKPLKVY